MRDMMSASRCRLTRLISVMPPTLLKLRRHRAVGIALSIPDIEIGTVAARDGIPSTAILPTAAVVPFALVAAAVMIPAPIGIHILGRQDAVRIAHPVAGTEVPAVAARWIASRHAILHLLDGGSNVLDRQSLTRE